MVETLTLDCDREATLDIRVQARALDLVPLPILVYDLDGQILHANNAAVDLSGHGREDLVGRSVVEDKSPEEVATFQGRVAEACRRGEVTYEVEKRRRDGAPLPLEVCARLVQWDSGPAILAMATDVGPRKRAERIHRETDAHYRLLADHTDDLVTLNDVTGRRLYVSPSVERRLGFSPAEFGALEGHEWTHPDDLPAFERARADALQGQRGRAEFRFQRRDGAWVWLETTFAPVTDDRGEVVQLLHTTRDVTERKEAEQALAHQKALLASLIDSIPDMVFYKDLDGVYLGCNPAFAEFAGRPPGEVVGSTDHDLFSADVADYFRRNDRLMLARQAPRHNEEWVAYPDGRRLLLDTLKTPYRGPDGELLGVLGVSRDITERKRVEEQLRAAVALHERTLATAATAVVMVDTGRRITEVNAAFCEMTGYAREEVVGRHCRILGGESCGSGCSLFDSRHEGRLRRRQCEIRTRDGRVMSILKNADVVRNAAGRVTGGIESFVDVTELTAARAEAERASRAKSEFLANMSHEIRTPMTAILGFAEAVLNGCPGDCDHGRGDLREQLEIILHSGRYLLDLINDILDLSKIEADKLEVERIACSPRAIVGQVETLVQPRCEAKGLALDVAAEGALPETVVTDPMRLRQILINLLGNAIKFTDAGRVGLAMRLGTLPDGEPTLECDVTDTGIGMTEEQADRLFQPFSQADASTTRMYGGTGLGLAISKRLAAALGGDLRLVATRPGEGSRFRVTVAAGSLAGVRSVEPNGLSAQTADAGADAAAIDETPLSCRVLLAEDNPVNQKLVTMVLEKAGARVTVVDNGRLAVDAALAARDSGAPYDVVLMDMQMPVMDGYTATAALRERRYGGPIVALTAHAMAADRRRCLDAGCDAYASKPIDRAELIGTVRGLVGA